MRHATVPGASATELRNKDLSAKVPNHKTHPPSEDLSITAAAKLTHSLTDLLPRALLPFHLLIYTRRALVHGSVVCVHGPLCSLGHAGSTVLCKGASCISALEACVARTPPTGGARSSYSGKTQRQRGVCVDRGCFARHPQP